VSSPGAPGGRTPDVDLPLPVLVLLAGAAVLAVAHVLRGLLARAGQPPVMGEVLAGVVLGASGLALLPGDPSAALFTDDVRAVLKLLGQAALVLFLFTVGADLRQLRAQGRAIGAVAGASFLLPLAAGAVLALVVHDGVAADPPRGAFVLFLGTALAVTALPVLARIVEDRGLGDRAAGRVALGAAAAQELAVWPLLAVAVALAGGDGRPGAVLAGGAAALVLTAVLAPVVLPRLPERALGIGTLLALGAAAVATEVAGLHLVLGAVAFSALVPAGPRRAACALLAGRAARVGLAVGLPLFFALPALRVDLWALGADGLGLLGLVLVVAAAAKLVSASAAALWAGLPRDEALTVGALMNARGLVELLVLSVGLEAGLLDVRLYTVMVLMALVTTLATGPLVTLARDRSAQSAAVAS
jgi:Kef-type K+ transport system membrane component KefB